MRDDCRYVADITIIFCIVFMLQPRSMNSHAIQSSNSGCDGSSARIPKSSGVSTSPMPKNSCHIRFTKTLATVGLFGSTSHFAKVSRVGGAFDGTDGKNAGTP